MQSDGMALRKSLSPSLGTEHCCLCRELQRTNVPSSGGHQQYWMQNNYLGYHQFIGSLGPGSPPDDSWKRSEVYSFAGIGSPDGGRARNLRLERAKCKIILVEILMIFQLTCIDNVLLGQRRPHLSYRHENWRVENSHDVQPL
jgi:hypothetical protein